MLFERQRCKHWFKNEEFGWCIMINFWWYHWSAKHPIRLILPQDLSLWNAAPPRLWFSSIRSLETLEIRTMLKNWPHFLLVTLKLHFTNTIKAYIILGESSIDKLVAIKTWCGTYLCVINIRHLLWLFVSMLLCTLIIFECWNNRGVLENSYCCTPLLNHRLNIVIDGQNIVA